MSDLPHALARHYAAFAAKDADADPWRPDATMVTPLGTCRGRDEIFDFITTFWAAFPDSRHEIVRSLTEGGFTAVEGRLQGTQTGPLSTPAGDVPPTGRHVDLRWMALIELQGEELVYEELYFDQMDLMTQLGITPGAPAEASAGTS